MSEQITELRSKNYTMSAIAEYLGISKSSIFAISQKIDRKAEQNITTSNNEVQVISIESKGNESSETPAKVTSASVTNEVPPVKSDRFSAEHYHRWDTQRNRRYSDRVRRNYGRNRVYTKIQFNDIQITFNPSQPEAEDDVT